MNYETEPTQLAAAVRNYVSGRDELLDGDYHLDHPLAGHNQVGYFLFNIGLVSSFLGYIHLAIFSALSPYTLNLP